MRMLLSTATVSRLTGATVRMIGHWVRTGLLRPSGIDAWGKGSRRQFTFQDVIVLHAILSLREGNCPLQKIRTAIRYLKAHYPDVPTSQVLAKLTLLTDGKKVYLLTDEHQMMDVVTRQLQITWAVPLGRIILETSQRLEAMPQTWTEPFIIEGRLLHIALSRKRSGEPFVARCIQLPGAVVEAPTAEEAVIKLRTSITFAIIHEPQSQRRRRSTLKTAS